MKGRGKLMLELAEKILSTNPASNLTIPAGSTNAVDEPKLNQEVANSDETSVPTVNLPAVEEPDLPLITPDDLEQDDLFLPVAENAIPLQVVELGNLPLSVAEKIDKQTVEIPLLSTNKERLPARPVREKKMRGREKIQDILKQTDDSINDPLFSSDSDNYVPSSSSSDEESDFSKRIKVFKKVHDKIKVHVTSRLCMVNARGRPLLEKYPNDVDKNQASFEDNDVFLGRGPVPRVIDEGDAIVDGNPGQVELFIRSPEKKKRRKGENIDQKDWERNVSAAKRRRGESYFGLKRQQNEDGPKYKFNNERKGKELKDRCSCKNRKNFKCDKITVLDRNKLFTNFWKNIDSWETKRAVIVSLVDKSQPNWRRSNTDIENTRKNVSFQYHLKVGDEKIRVCKKMFLNTFCLGEKSVRSWVLKGVLDQYVPPENNPDDPQPMNEIGLNANVDQSKKDAEKRDGIRQFFNSLPKMESHYCRARTSKEYLEPNWETKSQLYREYSRICSEKNTEPASRALFHKVFITMNLGFFTPKKDQCETCIKHKLGKISQDEFQNHQNRKEGARKEKDSDKKKSEETNKILVVAVDVQKVLTCPDIKASSSYYKTKLKVHNYSIFNLANHDVTCYIWHEGNGQLDGDIFASMLVRYLNKQKELNPGLTEIIIWSDGCTNQNRCETVANSLLYFSVKNNVTVYQKYLEVGHTQMEVDSVHSTIERKIKKHEHYVPADYVRDIREARMEPRPYHTETLTYKDFFQFSDGYYKSIRPGNKKGDPYVTDLRCLKYASDGHIWYKLDFSEEWQLLPRRPKPTTEVYSEIKPLYNKPVPITARKFRDLQDLKNLLEEDYHFFYNSLCHED